MPSTDPVSSITNCYRLMVSYTDPVHSFIISERTVEPTGSSILIDLFKVEMHAGESLLKCCDNYCVGVWGGLEFRV